MLTNYNNLALPMAVWLAADDYDLADPDSQTVSATGLIRPIKMQILTRRMQQQGAEPPAMDIVQNFSSRMGSAFHLAVEMAWLNNLEPALEKLGYSYEVIERIKVNPAEVSGDDIPVYLEQRTEKELNGWLISGKYDFVLDGEVQDIKSTKVGLYMKSNKEHDFVLQGSIYRWLNPEIITKPTMTVNYIFTDWYPMRALSDSSYPGAPLLSKQIPLLSLGETREYIESRLEQLEALADADQEEMPRCTPRELWQDPSEYKYYSQPPELASRASKNFREDAGAAYEHQRKKGGFVVEVPSTPKRCNYCAASAMCQQAAEYRAQGLLQPNGDAL
jgi:hypothetical protein